MPTSPRALRWPHALATAALACAVSSAAIAAPFATTYGSVIQGSGFPEIINGQRYTITLVFDNQGNSANGQTWNATHLTCIFWRMNNAQNVVYAQDLTAKPPSTVSGTATTDASGALTAMFTSVIDVLVVPASQFTASGFAPAPTGVQWYANDWNDVFIGIYGNNGNLTFDDPAGTNGGGVRMAPARWTAPVPFNGPCTAAPAPAPGSAAAVPALGEWGLALLGLGFAGMGARRLRRLG